MEKPPTMCEVCGLDVEPDDLVAAEMSVAGAMCPTAMNFHAACYERASAMWQPDPDSICSVDNEFPETMQWTAQQASQES